ncbi:MAG: ABC transporter permease [Planctomycetales bacterium]
MTPFPPPDSFAATRRRAAARLLGTALGPLLGLAIVISAFWVADEVNTRRLGRSPKFGTLPSAQLMAAHASEVAIPALGMTLIIIAGGIDLSAGTAIALSATVTAWCFRERYDPALAVAASLLAGCLSGAFNGALISALRVVPFIVTLGTMTVFLGLGRILADDTPIRMPERGMVPEWLLELPASIPEPRWIVFPYAVWLMLALAGLTSLLLRFTVFGRHVFAVGSNEATARLCGVPVRRVRVLVYATAGLFIGVAGLLQFARLSGQGDPTAGAGKELEIIAAVVIGGGSLSGGRGSVLGTLSGAAIMSVINHGCVLLGVGDAWQRIVIGVIIVAAVAIDQLRQRRLAG